MPFSAERMPAVAEIDLDELRKTQLFELNKAVFCLDGPFKVKTRSPRETRRGTHAPTRSNVHVSRCACENGLLNLPCCHRENENKFSPVYLFIRCRCFCMRCVLKRTNSRKFVFKAFQMHVRCTKEEKKTCQQCFRPPCAL